MVRRSLFTTLVLFLLLAGISRNAASQALGYLQVNVLNAEAAVYVDGRYTGTAAPGRALNIMEGYPVGTVRVTVEATSYESQSSVYAITEGAWTQAVFQLSPKQADKPAAVPPPPGGWSQPRPTVSPAERLLVDCRKYMKDKALSTPPGRNAMECFQHVLEDEPGNAEALKGLARIEAIYAGWVRSNLKRDRLDRAQTYLRRLMSVNPDSPTAWSLQKQLDDKIQQKAAQSGPSTEPAETPAHTPAVQVAPLQPLVQPTSMPTIQSAPQPSTPVRTIGAGTAYPDSSPALARLPAGCFTMGSPFSENGRDVDENPYQVCVESFELARKEVTIREFALFAGSTGYRTDAENNISSPGCYSEGPDQGWTYVAGRTWRDPGFYQTPDEPVVCVSWNDALAYIKWYNAQTGQKYRLPTEAEWEYAARAGSSSARHWGERPSQACSYANVADKSSFKKYQAFVPHECEDGHIATAPVGSYQPNAFGLYDMLGNVSEWVCSYYRENYDHSVSKCARSGRGGLRTNRGGAWMTKPDWVRSAVRARLRPDGRADSVGIRLVKD